MGTITNLVPIEEDSKLRFKSPSVENEFSQLNPKMKGIFKESPYPMRVTSGYRDPETNASVGGVPGSYHTQGKAVDIGLDSDPRAVDYLTQHGAKVIHESDHNHVQMPDLPDSSGKITDLVPIEEPKKEETETEPASAPYEEAAVSPLSIGQRARLGFGNKEGSIDYLKSKGMDAKYQGEDLFANGKQVDPNNTRGWAELTVPGSLYYTAKDALNSEGISDFAQRNPTNRLNSIASASQDMASDVAESPAEVLNYLTTLAGGTVGSAAGLLGGPVAPVTAPGGMIAGSAAGGAAAEKAKEGIGKMLGVYKTGGEYLTPEAKDSAIEGGLSAVIPAAMQGLDLVTQKAAQKALEKKIPQRLYATGTGLTGVREFKENPEIVDTLMKEDATLGEAPQRLRSVERMYEPVLKGKSVTQDELNARFPGVMRNAVKGTSSESRSGAVDAAQDVIDKLKAQYFKAPEQEIVPGGVMRRPSLEEFKTRFNLQKPTSDAYISSPEEASFDDIVDYYLQPQNKLANPANKTKAITRSAGGYPANMSPYVSERVSKVGEPKQYGEDILPKSLLKKDVPQRRLFVPEETKILTDTSPVASEDDIARLYQQTYPEESIALPSKTVTKEAPPIDLHDLNQEKAAQAREAKRVYESEGASGTAKQKAKKSMADMLRRVIEQKAPESRHINERFHAYDVLNDALEKQELEKVSKPFSRFASKEALYRALMGGRGGMNRLGQFLYDMANANSGETVAGMLGSNKVASPAFRLFNQRIIRSLYPEITAEEQ